MSVVVVRVDDLVRAIERNVTAYAEWLDEPLLSAQGDIRECVVKIVDDALIDFAGRKYRGNQTHMAKALGVNRNTLIKKLKKRKGLA